jgi:DNA-binding MarR family transcriptional regulator
MKNISTQLAFFIHLAKAKTVISRRFDNRLSFNGLGFSDFIILVLLSDAPGEKMRRTDLAERVGLTQSGVTRMLLPMEKIGLIKRETDDNDARVSYVVLAKGGKELLKDGLNQAENLAEDLAKKVGSKKLEEASELLVELGQTVVY